MSDPVTNVEIEDVLSSIRRLVSNEERRTDDEAPDDEPETGKAGEKLVLTPAQRVDESRTSDTPETDAVEYEVHAPGRRGDAHRFEGVEDAEIVEAPETDRADDAAAGPGDATDDADEAGTAGAPAGHDPEAAEDGPQPASKEDIDLKELEARIAGFEAAVAEQDDEWEPDGSGGDDLVSDPVTPLPWQRDEAQDAAGGDTATDAAADARADDATAADPEARARPEEQDGHEEAGEWFADDAYLDEEALRDMVSEIVRQELQGELGERITRNVRKLVRREIHRALLSQGME